MEKKTGNPAAEETSREKGRKGKKGSAGKRLLLLCTEAAAGVLLVVAVKEAYGVSESGVFPQGSTYRGHDIGGLTAAEAAESAAFCSEEQFTVTGGKTEAEKTYTLKLVTENAEEFCADALDSRSISQKLLQEPVTVPEEQYSADKKEAEKAAEDFLSQYRENGTEAVYVYSGGKIKAASGKTGKTENPAAVKELAGGIYQAVQDGQDTADASALKNPVQAADTGSAEKAYAEAQKTAEKANALLDAGLTVSFGDGIETLSGAGLADLFASPLTADGETGACGYDSAAVKEAVSRMCARHGSSGTVYFRTYGGDYVQTLCPDAGMRPDADGTADAVLAALAAGQQECTAPETQAVLQGTYTDGDGKTVYGGTSYTEICAADGRLLSCANGTQTADAAVSVTGRGGQSPVLCAVTAVTDGPDPGAEENAVLVISDGTGTGPEIICGGGQGTGTPAQAVTDAGTVSALRASAEKGSAVCIR